MLTVRIIPCLDVRAGRVVKGVQFAGLRDAGDPLELAARYEAHGADELVMLDVSATIEERRACRDTLAAIRSVLSIPLTVGGGVRTIDDAAELLALGADKVAMNSAAVERPDLVAEVADRFGTQCAVVSVDASADGTGSWRVRTRSGTADAGLDAVAWSARAASLGAGEILLTSFDRDGARSGYDLDLVRAVANAAPLPLIASGGAGRPDDLIDAARAGATGLLAASILHEARWSVAELKAALAASGMEVRA